MQIKKNNMFEEQIKSEYGRILSLLSGYELSSLNDLIEFFQGETFYGNFIKSDSLYQNYKILNIISAEPVFRNNLYESDDVCESFYSFLSNSSSINDAYIIDLMKLSVDLRFNFTIRPLTTLLSFIFSDSLSISPKEALLKLNYFSGHNYILKFANELIESFSKNGNNPLINKYIFIKELKHSLKTHLSELNPFEIAEFTDDIFILLNSTNSSSFIVLTLMIFFDDIELYGVIEKLDSIEENISEFSKNDLVKLLNEVLNNGAEDFGYDTNLSGRIENDLQSEIEEDEEITYPESVSFLNDSTEDLIDDNLIPINNENEYSEIEKVLSDLTDKISGLKQAETNTNQVNEELSIEYLKLIDEINKDIDDILEK